MLNKFMLLCLPAALFLSGCSSFSAYKLEIRQGNYIAPEMRKKVKVGMSQQQVTNVLGTPLISDVFHANRWDYIYRLEEKGTVVEQPRLTLYFEGDFVKRIEDTQTDTNVTVIPVKK